MVMTLTRNQSRNVWVTILSSVVVCLIGVLVWLVVTWPGDAAAAPSVPVPQLNAKQYENINTGNDGSVDHYCVGSTGMWYEQQNPYTFTVEGNDPLCR